MERKYIAYVIGSYESNAWKSKNPRSGVYESEVTRTLDLNGGNPTCLQGGGADCQYLFSMTWGGGNECFI